MDLLSNLNGLCTTHTLLKTNISSHHFPLFIYIFSVPEHYHIMFLVSQAGMQIDCLCCPSSCFCKRSILGK